MTVQGPFATVASDENFKGDFDEWENEVVVAAYPPMRESPRLACKIKVDHGEPLSDEHDGHVLLGVVDDLEVGDETFEEFPELTFTHRVAITTDGFDRATRTVDPITHEGDDTAIGRRVRVYSTQAWAEYMAGAAEARHEARTDDQRERVFERRGY